MSSRLSLLAAVMSAGVVVAAQEPPRTSFKASLDLVSVAVVVRGPDGRLVPDLRASDFEVLDCGSTQPIVQFQQGGDAEARLALLVDSSGSMVLGAKRERSRLATEFLIAGFKGADTASVFSFDSRVRRLTPFTRDADALRAAVTSVEPFGATNLYDAIVDTVQTVTRDAPRARAVLLLTDGMDNGSVVSPEDAANAAAALDIPLYVLAVHDDDLAKVPVRAATDPAAQAATLHDLAIRTGGLAADAVTPAQLSAATHTILAELRQQYVLAFPAASSKGWHELTIRVRKGRVHTRSRDGYRVS